MDKNYDFCRCCSHEAFVVTCICAKAHTGEIPAGEVLTNDACSSEVEGEVGWMTFLPSAERIWLVESKVNYRCWLHTLRKTNIPLARHICACLTGVAESNRCLYLEEDRSDV